MPGPAFTKRRRSEKPIRGFGDRLRPVDRVFLDERFHVLDGGRQASDGEGKAAHGLEFPGDDGPPDYGDFLYFSITVAATSQTSDVSVSSRAMRRLVLAQALLAFVFNTGVLALTINILAGLVS